ncbi:MAG: hypothetical protein ACE5G2_04910 [Candidatus Krumholzibacteriia bacterium]
MIPVLLVGLLSAGCDAPDAPTVPTTPVLAADRTPEKADRGPRWVAHPRRFVSGLRVASLVITPSRMLATTLGADQDKIVSINEYGGVQPFGAGFEAPADAVCHLEVSSGLVEGFPEDEVYVSLGRDIWRLSPVASEAEIAATLPGSAGDVTGLCFDRSGDFDFGLLILVESGAVHRLLPDEPVGRIGFVGPGGWGPSVASAHSGAHAGQLLVAFPSTGQVRALSPEGSVTFVTGWSGVSGALAIPDTPYTFARTGGMLFVAVETGEIYLFSAQGLAGHAGELFLPSLHTSGSGLATQRGSSYALRGFSRHMGAELVAAFVQRPAITTVEMDLRPGVAVNRLTLGSTSAVPVGILSSPYFSPRELDAPGARLAGAAPVPSGKRALGRFSDLNADGEPDLTLYFRPCDMQLDVGTTTVVLDGATFAGEPVRGSDRVQVWSP